MSLDRTRLMNDVSAFWDNNILDSLSEYIAIPNKSPLFDANWKSNGFMDDAVNHVVDWARGQDVDGLTIDVHELPNRTPTILMKRAGEIPGDILIYGHLDKQPEFTGWEEDLGPWVPVLKDDKLYGRGGADDGYAIYSAICVLKLLLAQDLPLPTVSVIIECSEESGSPDLPYYMESLAEDIGQPDLIICLDSTCGNYDQLWITTSLRGMVTGELTCRVLQTGAHSGAAGGIVPSSFRLVRQLLSRIEDEDTGNILPSFLNEQVPDERRREAAEAGQVLEGTFGDMFSIKGKTVSDDPTELVLNNTWAASLEVTGIDGIPDPENAGNVLRPYTTAKIALRLPPTTDADNAAQQLKALFTNDTPMASEVSFKADHPNPGWHAPATVPHLEAALQSASMNFYGKPAIAMGCGGSIPFMKALADQLPDAQFVVTGVLGPMSNAHGPNEFLHLPMVKKLTACIASICHDWGQSA